MSKDLQLAIRINGDRAAADMRRFTNAASSNLSHLSRQTKQLWKDFNGFSTATKLFAAAGGLAAVRASLNTNLNFERDLLEMKQNAKMTITQVGELRKLAMETAKDTLQMPDAIVQGEKAYARAGMKFEEIRDSIAEAARSATVMRSTVEQIANMDFDLQNKFNISAKDMKAAHNMAYYHGNEGRFETASMAQLAPVYLNALKGVGVSGMEGWNFTGALTQSIMKSAPATEPSQVATLIQQGLGHIAMYAKDLGKVGIDVKKYGPGGQFGVEGLLKLAEAMKAKGLTDIFKLDKAGIKDQEAKKFWLQMMNDFAEIRKQMGVADQAAQNDQIGVDLAEIKTANFGKIMAAEIQVQKLTLSEPVQQGISAVGTAAEYAANNPDKVAKGVAAGAGLYLLNRFTNNRKGRLAEEATSLGGAGSAAVQSVLVTNWPASMMPPGEKIRNKGGGKGGAPSAGGASSGSGLLAMAPGAAGLIGKALLAYEVFNQFKPLIQEFMGPTLTGLLKKAETDPLKQYIANKEKEKIDTGGTLNIKIDGPAKVTGMTTNDPRMNMNVDAGPTMAGAR